MAVTRRDLRAATGERFVKVKRRQVATCCDKVARQLSPPRSVRSGSFNQTRGRLRANSRRRLLALMVPQSISRMD
jgi:hypothetical protein